LVWNDINTNDSDFSLRSYATSTGLSAVLGYVTYPAKDSSGFYYQRNYLAKDGLEKIYDNLLSGKNGMRYKEVNAHGDIVAESTLVKPVDGTNLKISIDKDIQKEFYKSINDLASKAGYRGAAGAMMDVFTGEMIAMVNFPEYDPNIISLGDDNKKIAEYLSDKNNPFLNRVVSGLYTPGSIVKPFLAIGALTEKIITPEKEILSTGELIVPNPYDKDKPSVFKDWKAHGYTDMRKAIAVSSNVYFFQIGGGFQNQKGLGIENIEKYLHLFGFGQKTDIALSGEKVGLIPNPEWKRNIFAGEDWRLGDTYNTSIGQYGLQVTPIQALRAVATLANGGRFLVPTLLSSSTPIYSSINLDKQNLKVIRDGMRMTVTEGTAKTLNFPFVNISAKTGTAELGVYKDKVNSWTIGYFPSDKPKYAFVLVMEKGQANNQVGAVLVLKSLFEWMNIYKQDYFK
jgi:penicillin-binding protein 2